MPQHQVVPSTVIARICAARNAAITTMEQAIAAMKQGQELAEQARLLAEQAHAGHHFPLRDRSKEKAYVRLFRSFDPDESLEIYRQYVDAAVWTRLLSMTGAINLMDRTAREDFEAALADNVPEVTEDNVRATFEGLLRDAGLIFQRGLARAFSELDRRFKSHDGFKLGSRVILTNVFDEYGHLNTYSRMGHVITDIERVFAVLDGKASTPGSVLDRIRDDRQGVWGAQQSVTETDYFRVRCYKNGNAHLWFTRDDLVEKVNLLLAEYYGAVLPDAYPGEAEQEADLRSKSGLPSKDLAYYPTPKEVAERVVSYLGLPYSENAYVLEPSAGTGNLAEAISRTGARVDCIEIHEGRAQELRRRLPAANVMSGNFLRMPATPKYTHVVMNPPFYGTHWMQHVIHAFDFLAPGGVLLAILPVTAEIGDTKKHRSFRAWAKKHSKWGRLDFRDLPPESFADSGTRINTCFLTLYKG